MQNVDKESVIRYVGESKQQVIDSRDVAKMIGKSHAHLMRDISQYINDILTDPKLDSCDIATSTKLRSLDFFIESSYK